MLLLQTPLIWCLCSVECRRQSSFLICLECCIPGCALWHSQTTAHSFTFILEAYGRCLEMTVAAIRGYIMMSVYDYIRWILVDFSPLNRAQAQNPFLPKQLPIYTQKHIHTLTSTNLLKCPWSDNQPISYICGDADERWGSYAVTQDDAPLRIIILEKA